MGKAAALHFLDKGHKVFGTILPDMHDEQLEGHENFTRVEGDLMEEAPLRSWLGGLEENIHVGVLTVG